MKKHSIKDQKDLIIDYPIFNDLQTQKFEKKPKKD